jgi:hypothetical protein
MSGYVPRRVLNARIGATIEKNQTPMQAGLAPRVGKSGASIRLYYQRVDGCCDFCDPEPIQILKRGIFPGNTVNVAGWVGTGGGGGANLIVGNALGSPSTLTNVYYVVVFNREITPSPSIVENPGPPGPPAPALLLRTPLGVNWNTFVLQAPAQGGITGGEVINTNIYAKDIPETDFKVLNFGNLTAPTNADIGQDGSGFQIVLDGTTQGAIPPPGYVAAPGLVPAEQLGLNNITGSPGQGGPLGFWAGSTINDRLLEAPLPGLPIGLCSPAAPLPNPQQLFNGAMSYLVTNPAHFGGYALIFNITRLIIASQTYTTNYESAVYNTNISAQRQYRSGLANITWYNTGPNPAGINTGTQDRNNIGLTYTPNEKTTLTNTDNCEFAAPIAPFKIARTNLPILTLIDSDAW